jgi:outer membrane protein TolC
LKRKKKMKKYFTVFLVVVFVLGGFTVFSQTEGNNTDDILNELIKEALENNPKLEAAVQRALASEKVIPQAGALPDPQITFGLLNLPINSFSFSQEPMTGKVIGVMQMFPFPGKLSLATDIAEYESAAIKYQQEEIRNKVVQLVKQVFFDLYAIDRAFETTEKNKALMEQFIHMVETKYATGSGLQQDVLRAQVELSKLEDDLIMWQQKRFSAAARLNALLNRPVDSPVDKTLPELMLPESPVAIFSAEEIDNSRPLLKVWNERIQKAGTAIKLAERDIWPNFTVGTSYRQRNNLSDGRQMADFFSATVSLNIPLYFRRKQKANVVEKELTLNAARFEYENVKINVLSEIESILAELERNRKRVELYKDGILIQAQQSLESAHAGYRVGKVDFLTLINNWMMLQNYELQYFFALSNFYKNLANYELAVGGDVIQEIEPHEDN